MGTAAAVAPASATNGQHFRSTTSEQRWGLPKFFQEACGKCAENGPVYRNTVDLAGNYKLTTLS